MSEKQNKHSKKTSESKKNIEKKMTDCHEDCYHDNALLIPERTLQDLEDPRETSGSRQNRPRSEITARVM